MTTATLAHMPRVNKAEMSSKCGMVHGAKHIYSITHKLHQSAYDSDSGRLNFRLNGANWQHAHKRFLQLEALTSQLKYAYGETGPMAVIPDA